MEEKGQPFFFSRIPVNKYRRNKRNRKSPLGKQSSNSYYGQELSITAKISSQKSDEKQDI